MKYREAFRPFAPSILAEHGPDWFEDYQDSPYMERTLRWREDSAALVPAVVHEDGTGRLQSVTAERNPRYHALIEAFRAPHRRAGDAQHQLQRDGQADPPHGGGRDPDVLHDGARRARGRGLAPGEGASED